MYSPIHHIVKDIDISLGGSIVLILAVFLVVLLLKTTFKVPFIYWILLIVAVFSFKVHWILGVMISILFIKAVSLANQEIKEEREIEELKVTEYKKTDKYKLEEKIKQDVEEVFERTEELEKSKPFLKKSLSSKIDVIGRLYVFIIVVSLFISIVYSYID
ncbi:hypothetical protein HOB87_10090 [Candidatus Woesearchaeota archaeon]|jgi:hypothetical protein|nr:hypothetical protein [Candidatus Woesearchaeota archaeon]